MNSSGYSDTPSILQAPLISAFIACILYGVVCTQTFAYYNRFPRDSMFIKTTVFSVCLLEGVHTGLLISVLNFYVVREGGDMDVLNLIYKGVGICYIFGYVSTYIVNMFYIWRIWIISSRSILSLIIATLSTARVAVEITFCTKSGTFSPHHFDLSSWRRRFCALSRTYGLLFRCPISCTKAEPRRRYARV